MFKNHLLKVSVISLSKIENYSIGELYDRICCISYNQIRSLACRICCFPAGGHLFMSIGSPLLLGKWHAILEIVLLANRFPVSIY